MCGLAGGKGIPASVAEHPCTFATSTAPSFGPVHGLRDKGPCRARRDNPLCPHGRPASVQRMPGHASATLTLDRYGHLFADELDAVADRLDHARRQTGVYRMCNEPELPDPDEGEEGPHVVSGLG